MPRILLKHRSSNKFDLQCHCCHESQMVSLSWLIAEGLHKKSCQRRAKGYGCCQIVLLSPVGSSSPWPRSNIVGALRAVGRISTMQHRREKDSRPSTFILVVECKVIHRKRRATMRFLASLSRWMCISFAR